MELEQRVQELEQELQILKGQIQATLLDIQEHLLTNTYSSLRAENSESPNNAGSRLPSSDEIAPSPRQNHNVRRLSLDELDTEEASTPENPSTVRQVVPATDWDKMAELEEWANHKVEQIGLKRTRELIRMYGDNGRFAPETRDALLQFVSLYEPDAPANAPAVRPPAPAQPRVNPARPRSAPKPPPATISQPHTRSKQQTRPTANAPQRVRSQQPAQPPIQPTQTPQPPSSHQSEAGSPSDSKEEAEAPQRLILKLIAGVQNAGMRWTKNYG